MQTGPDGRRRIDLTLLPRWAQWLTAAATVAAVTSIALLAAHPSTGPAAPIAAITAAAIAFAFVAWHTRHHR
ncbi:hypothetical protein [Actinacidiphila bryophytorum]|uniref:Uncharacterized protein n=1 Tax=Actinacidiphila bryophytorum TaxID=1436133 RepID=A0A9W4E4B2_9ACTN|nr:hypothetical protein [Actinacidiphila bryophytorum]MBM9438048.1 hypothetical protein [Actinacidiphila bryophytorum]MBN6547860.1 hypothetical protein [Actinacidiphila bryophytorum]CAG7618259.1 conserved hypothetical protein [Actinacidiphila bryophytorum]